MSRQSPVGRVTFWRLAIEWSSIRRLYLDRLATGTRQVELPDGFMATSG